MPDLRLRLAIGDQHHSPTLWPAGEAEYPIARLPVYDGFGWTREQQVEHGRLIAEAVNERPELLALLREARPLVERCRQMLHDAGCHDDAIYAQVTLDSIDAELRDA